MKLTPVRLERAARAVCSQRGINPDAPHFGGDYGFRGRSMWQVVADEIQAWLQIGAAVYMEIDDDRTCEAQPRPSADVR